MSICSRFVRRLSRSRFSKKIDNALPLYLPTIGRRRRANQPDEMARMGELIGEMTQAGVLLATEGCQPSAKGFHVRLTNGNFSITDGPFTETKELIAGFALIKVDSKDEALRWCKRFLEVAGDGESEIRLLHEAADFGEVLTPEFKGKIVNPLPPAL